eukprot:CAMPEP_0114658392 /NCGR_PEP_ID=MMETSP0191-20121206/15659_1 /TAXON_ID=126664 /ORGANISM="Sorites sp." /LENGTH=407 /DNA_ID=CAMNT_0001880283 /DNA_START=14 /DNA_END=1237 /DNA_ORIENTATION=-
MSHLKKLAVFFMVGLGKSTVGNDGNLGNLGDYKVGRDGQRFFDEATVKFEKKSVFAGGFGFVELIEIDGINYAFKKFGNANIDKNVIDEMYVNELHLNQVIMDYEIENIPKYVCQNDEELVYVMEGITGLTSRYYFAEKSKGLIDIINKSFNLIDIINDLHNANIYYLDFAINNVLMDDDGNTWLIDFGMSHLITMVDRDWDVSARGPESDTSVSWFGRPDTWGGGYRNLLVRSFKGNKVEIDDARNLARNGDYMGIARMILMWIQIWCKESHKLKICKIANMFYGDNKIFKDFMEKWKELRDKRQELLQDNIVNSNPNEYYQKLSPYIATLEAESIKLDDKFFQSISADISSSEDDIIEELMDANIEVEARQNILIQLMKDLSQNKGEQIPSKDEYLTNHKVNHHY